MLEKRKSASIEQNIIDAVEISKRSHIPVLFMSNPGLGKTTILNRYAQKNDMHLETLIGSRFTPEEINGYQVNNGGDHLTHMNPEWFSRVQEKSDNGIPTLLFIDEISTCSEFVQGSLLSLIFDRTIGSGRFLPEDCLIVAAANYAGNLPETMNIMAPTLNRFVIINLNDNYTALDMIDEFLTPPKPAHYPERPASMSQESKNVFMEKYRNIWREVFLKYSDPTSSLGLLNIGNQNVNSLYSESKSFVYNFISGRSISYLARCLIAYSELGISNLDILHKITDGLVGNGTFQFADETQSTAYRELLYSHFDRLVNNAGSLKMTYLPLVNDLEKDIASYFVNLENPGYSSTDAAKQRFEICTEMKIQLSIENVVVQCKSVEGRAKFLSTMDSLLEFHSKLRNQSVSKNLCFMVGQICMDFYPLYCAIAGFKCDYRQAFGINDQTFIKIVLYRHREGKSCTYKKASLVKTSGRTMSDGTFLNVGLYVPEGNGKGSFLYDRYAEVLDFKGETFSYTPMKDFLKNESKALRTRKVA